MIIREASHTDAPAIARVTVDTWRTAYKGIMPDEHLDRLSYDEREEFLLEFLSNTDSNTFTYVAEEESGQVVGFASGGPERTGNSLYKSEIYALYILKDYQRKGVGRLLVQTVIKRLKQSGVHSLLIWVLKDNPCRRFYETIGGRLVEAKTIEVDGFKCDLVGYGWNSCTYIPKKQGDRGTTAGPSARTDRAAYNDGNLGCQILRKTRF